MVDAEIAVGLDAAFKAVELVDGVSFIQDLLGDCYVGAKLEWGRALRLDGLGWTGGCRWCGWS